MLIGQSLKPIEVPQEVESRQLICQLIDNSDPLVLIAEADSLFDALGLVQDLT
jgi:hypothetical protein